MSIVEIDSVSFAYERETVLENISLKVSKGDFLAVLGPNGGGKTTLLKLILGLIKPDKGCIKVFGEKPGKHSKKIGYVPQYSYINKNFPLSVMESVLMGLTKKKLFNFKYTETDKRRALETLDKVDMSEYSDRQIHGLSGGQRQRVLLARALLSDPDLIILDEPTSNIDPYGKFCFFTFLEELSREKTIILVSHNINVIATKINRVACVNRFLYYNSEPVLTKEMVEILYGTHDEHVCSFGKYFSDDFTHIEKKEGPISD